MHVWFVFVVLCKMNIILLRLHLFLMSLENASESFYWLKNATNVDAEHAAEVTDEGDIMVKRDFLIPNIFIV